VLKMNGEGSILCGNVLKMNEEGLNPPRSHENASKTKGEGLNPPCSRWKQTRRGWTLPVCVEMRRKWRERGSTHPVCAETCWKWTGRVQVCVEMCWKWTKRGWTLPVHVKMRRKRRGGVQPTTFALKTNGEGLNLPFVWKHVESEWGGVEPSPFVWKCVEMCGGGPFYAHYIVISKIIKFKLKSRGAPGCLCF